MDFAGLDQATRVKIAQQVMAHTRGGQVGSRQMSNQDQSRAMDYLARNPELASKFAEMAGVNIGRPGIGRDTEGGESNLNTAQMSQGASTLDRMMTERGQPEPQRAPRTQSPPLPPRRPAQADYSNYADPTGDQTQTQYADFVDPTGDGQAPSQAPTKGVPDGGVGVPALAGGAAGVAAGAYIIYRMMQGANGPQMTPVLQLPDGRQRLATPAEVASAPSRSDVQSVQFRQPQLPTREAASAQERSYRMMNPNGSQEMMNGTWQDRTGDYVRSPAPPSMPPDMQMGLSDGPSIPPSFDPDTMKLEAPPKRPAVGFSGSNEGEAAANNGRVQTKPPYVIEAGPPKTYQPGAEDEQIRMESEGPAPKDKPSTKSTKPKVKGRFGRVRTGG